MVTILHIGKNMEFIILLRGIYSVLGNYLVELETGWMMLMRPEGFGVIFWEDLERQVEGFGRG